MATITRHSKNTIRGLRFRCGGYTKLNGDALPAGMDPETTALMMLEDGALVPCYESVVLSLGHKGRIDMKHLHRGLEQIGWILAEVSPDMVEAHAAVSDPLCPEHGIILATRLMQSPGTPAHVIAHLTGYLRRAEEALMQKMRQAAGAPAQPTEDELLVTVEVPDEEAEAAP